VLVCGADPRQSLASSREQINEAIQELIPVAKQYAVKLGIEPLHPMYADIRSAVNTLKQANDIAEKMNSEWLGVVIDVYHTWWDPSLKEEIRRCGLMKKVFAFHVCDWKVPTSDFLLDRGLMGEGCIPLKEISGWIEQSGFTGCIEVEIFSEKYRKMNQDEYIEQIKKSFVKHL